VRFSNSDKTITKKIKIDNSYLEKLDTKPFKKSILFIIDCMLDRLIMTFSM